MNKKKNIKDIEFEISCYDPKPSIAKAMLYAGELGFEFSGHGSALGSDDFGLVKNYDGGYYYFGIYDYGDKVIADLTENSMDSYEDCKLICKGRLPTVLKRLVTCNKVLTKAKPKPPAKKAPPIKKKVVKNK